MNAKRGAGQASLFGDEPETIERLIVVLMLPAHAAAERGAFRSRSADVSAQAYTSMMVTEAFRSVSE